MSYSASYILTDTSGGTLTCSLSINQGLLFTLQGGIPGSIDLAGDICADPTRPGYVFVSTDDNGISYSTDFGATFTSVGGTYTTGGLKRITTLDSTVFVAVGSYISYSTNGGLTFSDVANAGLIYGSGANANAIKMLSNTTWLVGINDKLFKTTNSGTTWTALNGSNAFSALRVTSIAANDTGEKIWVATQNGIYYSANFGITFTTQEVFPESPLVTSLARFSDTILYLIAYPDSSVSFDTRLYYTIDGQNWSYYQYTGSATPTDEYQSDLYLYDENILISTLRSLDTFYSTDGGATLTTSSTPGKPGSVDGAIYPSYRLYNCDDETITIDTIQDFSEYTNPSQIVKLEEFPNTCWQVGIYDEVLTEFSVVTVDGEPFATCADCIPVYYILTNCETEAVIYAEPSAALLANKDKTVQILGEGGVSCYTVAQATGFTLEILVPVTISQGGFEDCTCCLPVPAPEPTVYTRSIQRPYKQFYHITDSECDIKTNTTFAQNYYRLFQTIKNGIANSCPDVNFERIWLKKELSDYDKINPVGVCVPPVVTTELVCPPATLVACDIPTGVSGTGDFT